MGNTDFNAEDLFRSSATKAARTYQRRLRRELNRAKSAKLFRALTVGLLISALVAFFINNPEAYENSLVALEASNSAVAPLGASSAESAESAEPVESAEPTESAEPAEPAESTSLTALAVLEQLAVKGRAPKTGYARTEFYNAWPTIDGCSLRQRILKRDLGDSAVVSSEDHCTVLSGAFTEPYTGIYREFHQRSELSSGLQIDHVVALSDAWQKGAQNLDSETRYALATDPLNLLAADAQANQTKSDGDAATWLPSNKAFRCAYVARQISVKYKYQLWVTSAEKEAMQRVLSTCPNQKTVGI